MITSAEGRALIGEIPREQLLTETDGPFVAVSGRACQPQDVERVVAYLATAWNVSLQHARETVYHNFHQLLIST